ncbi:hypothetical protein DPMN_103325 [Dreissena polymorpha]|uniref:EGF-like domain-containing protein n=1 Tax=Dreissena polymorpha TaxID=45954 RepID=A0A9D4K2L6_DREPO|nr:hypothetical protein DPMN_103325 [Dreissena polymorpha]
MQDRCKNGATCANFLGGYNCTCAPGWQGTNCDDGEFYCAVLKFEQHFFWEGCTVIARNGQVKMTWLNEILNDRRLNIRFLGKTVILLSMK